MKAPAGFIAKKLSTLSAMDTEREQFKQLWRELADYILPQRYQWLLSDVERRRKLTKNPNIIDGTGTKASKILASGMFNGITSPSRPWFKLRLKNTRRNGGVDINENYPARRWLDEVTRRMLITMASSNFYNALPVMYMDLVVFGSASVLIYEDYKSVFRCYNCSLGEFYLENDSTGRVGRFARKYSRTVEQCVEWFGLENCPDRVQIAFKQGGSSLQQTVNIYHMIEKNEPDGLVPKIFEFRELYWVEGETDTLLAASGYYEMPGIFPRWEISSNDSYGSSPGMDALGDIIQLQHEQKRKGQSLDYMLKPPSVADIQLQNRPTALLPGGLTYVAGVNNVGVKPIYTVNPPIQELTLDIQEVQERIRDFFHNPLFNMISQLDTVRTATEIDARREEKLVQLGPVLERFENEALDPAIARIYSIMDRAGLIPPAPEGLEEEELEIQYVSILSSAQTAVGVAPTERWLQLIGNVAAMYPAAINVPNWEELLRDYGQDIGVKAKHINSKEESAAATQRQEEMLQAKEGMAQMQQGAQAAKLLSETDVGGGANALQQLMSA